MTHSRSYLILGNGIAGITAPETLRVEQPAAQITLVTDEPVCAYYRPALKDYLAGHVHEEQLWARPATFYQDRRLQVVIGQVTGIAPANHQVRLQTGQILPYHKLLVAIGAPPTRTAHYRLWRRHAGIGLLALGERAETLDFKRAIDAGVNLLPVASTLFRDDFSLSAWLDQLAVPPPLMSVGKADMHTTKMRRIGFPS